MLPAAEFAFEGQAEHVEAPDTANVPAAQSLHTDDDDDAGASRCAAAFASWLQGLPAGLPAELHVAERAILASELNEPRRSTRAAAGNDAIIAAQIARLEELLTSLRRPPIAITIAATSGWRTTTGSPRSVGTRHSAKTVGAWSPLPVGSYAMGWPSLT